MGRFVQYQEFRALPEFAGNQAALGSHARQFTLGSRIVDGEPAGVAVRESEGLVADCYALFVPHYIDAPRGPRVVYRWSRELRRVRPDRR